MDKEAEKGRNSNLWGLVLSDFKERQSTLILKKPRRKRGPDSPERLKRYGDKQI